MKLLVPVILLIAALLALPVTDATASSYGRTKIQSGDISWWEVSSQAVTVYFPLGAETQAESLIAISERELADLSARFDYRPSRPIPVILYINPSSFRQTEVISGETSEAVGGVTEFFKSRVVVPFTGSWDDFRHVVSHELNHAYVYDMLYQRSIQEIIYSKNPLWTLEGLAEYTSLGWDAQSEGEFKDMVIGEEILSIPDLGRSQSFLVYRQGQAVYHFMASRYGEERLVRFVHALESDMGLEGALNEALGISVEQFDRRFQTWARETYWPRLGWQEGPDNLGYEILEGHEPICQVGTILSRAGDRIAGVEQRHANLCLTVRSSYDGDLLERYFQTGGIGDEGLSFLFRICDFSPSGDSLVVARHRIDGDFLSICHDGESYDLPLVFDLIREPVWSPDGAAICFSAMAGGNLDLYIYDLGSGYLRRLTDTMAAELYPAWRADGSGLVFVSEQNDGSGCLLLEIDAAGQDADYPRPDTLLADRGGMRFPMPCGSGIMFMANRPDMWNLFLLEEDGSVRQLSCLYRSVDYPSWSDSSGTLAYTAPGLEGCGVFLGDGTDERTVSYEDLSYLTVGRAEGRRRREANARVDLLPDSSETRAEPELVPAEDDDSYSSSFSPDQIRIRPYSPRLTIDYVSAIAGYDSYLGLAGYSQFVLSDMLSHHRVIVNADVSGDIADADAAVYYINLPRRLDIGVGAFRVTNKYIFVYSDHEELIRDTDLGGVLYFRYPFTQGFKLQGEATYRNIRREGLVNSNASSSANILSTGLSLVVDNAQWGAVGPRIGSRLRASVEVAPGIGDFASYMTVSGDLRHYVWVSSQATLALRLAGATSWGDDAQRFYLGGAVPHRRLTGEVKDLDDLVGFYSNYGDHLRGVGYSEVSGRRYLSATAELRVPFIRSLVLDAPLPMTITQARGVLFADVGTAFDDPADFRGASTEDGYHLEDILLGIGLGWRVNLGVFVLKHDIAWRTDLGSISAHPSGYITFGGEF